jgi:hypothetical protein
LAGENKVLGENLSQCCFVHHKPHMLCPDANPGRRGGKPATNRLSYGTASLILAITSLQNMHKDKPYKLYYVRLSAVIFEIKYCLMDFDEILYKYYAITGSHHFLIYCGWVITWRNHDFFYIGPTLAKFPKRPNRNN